MKNLKIITLLIFVATLLACSDASDEDLGTTGEGILTAKVDGEDFSSLKVAVVAVVSNNVVNVQGSNSNGDYIRFSILNYSGPGVYKTGDAITNVNTIQYGTVNPIVAWISTFTSGSGTIEITEETSSTVSGTFYFTGINDDYASKVITEGVFSAPKN
ncbi:DUF6252 family protein [Polaribacter sargassicola]|uniref:DUF6252 family protein n=1 Tax=Polaribacter sargassicola TaxID=2836891 RepID=UPI001F2977B4|nr:DUF6252 family protein [Polaribacter sp. DS7-9]MCG1037520.1 hypothetical protein [Polaribacter sp. DS7-9]